LRKLTLGFGLLGLLLAQLFSATEEKKDLTYSINVGLVVLPVAVLDRSGRFVSGLEAKQFIIYEDEVPQQIQVFDQKDIPVAVGLVIDNSTSMVTKRPQVISAAVDLAESSNPEDQIFVIHFYEHISFALKLGEAFTSNIDELRAAVGRIAGLGRTALYDAVTAGLDHLGQAELPKRVLVVISDGGDNASTRTLEETLDMATASNALIYCIGIYDEHARDRNPKVLKQLAEISGGDVYFPRGESELSQACKRIAKDIRSQYTLGYIPGNQKKDGSYRKIRVTVDAPGEGNLTVRTRSGYMAPRS